MRRLLLAVLLLLAAPSLSAMTNALALARAALRDGLWEVARSNAAKVPGEEAQLIILESFAEEGDWASVKKSLASWKGPFVSPAFGYYQAVLDGRFADALALLRKSGSRAGVSEADLMEADLRLKLGERAAAEKLWRGVVARTNVSARVLTLACLNLGEETLLRRAYDVAPTLELRRRAGLRLGRVLLRDPAKMPEGAALILKQVKDSPDVPEAQAAFLEVAHVEQQAGRWAKADELYREAVETWPDALRLSEVQCARGEVLARLNRFDEALALFAQAAQLATNDLQRAAALVKQGDTLVELKREDEAMTLYRRVLADYPKTPLAKALKPIVDLRDLESRGRALYKDYRFQEARDIFRTVGEQSIARRDWMAYYEILCLYGLGFDQQAGDRAGALATSCANVAVRAETLLWLAKFSANEGKWRKATDHFRQFVELVPQHASASSALLWAARTSFRAMDFKECVQFATRLQETYPASAEVDASYLVQGRALIELARFDEAVLVLERVTESTKASVEARAQAALLRADALFAMGADDSRRYQAALEAFQAIVLATSTSPSDRLCASFKLGRTLEKLKRREEAIEQYYSHVMLAYREGRAAGVTYNDEARAAFSRAAFRLADEYESRGRDPQAIRILDLVVTSDVPAAEEATRRIRRITSKGRFL